MSAYKGKKRRRVFHVKQQQRLQRADALAAEAGLLCARSIRSALRWAVVIAAAAATGCTAICTCTNKFEAACTEAHGVVVQGSDAGVTHCMKEGKVLATWTEDGGAP